MDDRLPLSRDNRLMTSHTTHAQELWVSIIEKAYMKVNGGCARGERRTHPQKPPLLCRLLVSMLHRRHPPCQHSARPWLPG